MAYIFIDDGPSDDGEWREKLKSNQKAFFEQNRTLKSN